MLEQVSGQHQIAGEPDVVPPVPFSGESQCCPINLTVGKVSGVDADPFGDATLGEQLKKVTLAAPHLERGPTPEPVPLDEV